MIRRLNRAFTLNGLPLSQKMIKVPVKRELEMEFGQRGTKKQSGRRVNRSEIEEESLMLTGDLNVAMVTMENPVQDR
ncbi:MAG: hypothetical protein Ct9H300mP9_1990 [Candidatus Neomarinimicrobiota bacterium]|nr:MAG: hypothetical protein Ct9H300mP9_1990 [Candidatus Neomarinimicrobiota bacterium]